MSTLLEPVIESSREIVGRSGSNLAFALAVLPRRKRQDMGVFYAFCRVVDDIADDPGFSIEVRRAGLNRWRDLIHGRISKPNPGVETEFVDLCLRYSLKKEDLEAIVAGVEMDLEPLRFETTDELKRYCYHVASAVGLVSIGIFGYTDPATRVYAEQLGYALQWTNILRDIGEDTRDGRCYLPCQPDEIQTEWRKWLQTCTEHLECGLRYVQHVTHGKLRYATALPLLLGIQTVAKMRSASWDKIQQGIKISRLDVASILAQAAMA
ncbi:MAG TPA: phytoene/squalene synthase family protein, partial [Verrucomicrobiales bacterium]|nr:phytoene/squalene synthase family protein [Verrucomicrobiales bacterium]